MTMSVQKKLNTGVRARWWRHLTMHLSTVHSHRHEVDHRQPNTLALPDATYTAHAEGRDSRHFLQILLREETLHSDRRR